MGRLKLEASGPCAPTPGASRPWSVDWAMLLPTSRSPRRHRCCEGHDMLSACRRGLGRNSTERRHVRGWGTAMHVRRTGIEKAELHDRRGGVWGGSDGGLHVALKHHGTYASSPCSGHRATMPCGVGRNQGEPRVTQGDPTFRDRWAAHPARWCRTSRLLRPLGRRRRAWACLTRHASREAKTTIGPAPEAPASRGHGWRSGP